MMHRTALLCGLFVTIGVLASYGCTSKQHHSSDAEIIHPAGRFFLISASPREQTAEFEVFITGYKDRMDWARHTLNLGDTVPNSGGMILVDIIHGPHVVGGLMQTAVILADRNGSELRMVSASDDRNSHDRLHLHYQYQQYRYQLNRHQLLPVMADDES